MKLSRHVDEFNVLRLGFAPAALRLKMFDGRCPKVERSAQPLKKDPKERLFGLCAILECPQ